MYYTRTMEPPDAARPPRAATRPLNLRAPLAVHERLRALTARVPALSAHRLAVVALELGLDALERDPAGALVRPAPGAPPDRAGAPPGPSTPQGDPSGPPPSGEALVRRYRAALAGGWRHTDAAREAETSERTLRGWSSGERGLGADVAARLDLALTRRGF